MDDGVLKEWLGPQKTGLEIAIGSCAVIYKISRCC